MKDSIVGGLVAFGMVAVFGFVCWALVYMPIPEANQNALTLLIGVLSANVGGIVGYYFGSSTSSKRKDETIAKMNAQQHEGEK